MTRLYVPSSLASLADWMAAGEIPATALGDAVAAEDDSEDAEYAALLTAADASRSRRRVVLVVEAARSDAPVPMSDVVACHVDTADDADPDDDLAWYAPQEIPTLLR